MFFRFDECVEGGESIFLDAFTIADEFRVNFPDLFHTLTTVPATFQKVHYDRFGNYTCLFVTMLLILRDCYYLHGSSEKDIVLCFSLSRK